LFTLITYSEARCRQKDFEKKIIKNGTLIKKGKNIMKKIIGIVIASLVLCGIGYAGIQDTGNKRSFRMYELSTVCVDNYKFVVATTEGGVSVVQFWKPGSYNDSPSYPVKC
jgi:hypothetical protein